MIFWRPEQNGFRLGTYRTGDGRGSKNMEAVGFRSGENTGIRLVKAPHDMQPQEVLVVDISKLRRLLFAEMKAKTRYNIRLAEKRVCVFSTREKKYQEAFSNLSRRPRNVKNILPHPKSYYEKCCQCSRKKIFPLFRCGIRRICTGSQSHSVFG